MNFQDQTLVPLLEYPNTGRSYESHTLGASLPFRFVADAIESSRTPSPLPTFRSFTVHKTIFQLPTLNSSSRPQLVKKPKAHVNITLSHNQRPAPFFQTPKPFPPKKTSKLHKNQPISTPISYSYLPKTSHQPNKTPSIRTKAEQLLQSQPNSQLNKKHALAQESQTTSPPLNTPNQTLDKKPPFPPNTHIHPLTPLKIPRKPKTAAANCLPTRPFLFTVFPTIRKPHAPKSPSKKTPSSYPAYNLQYTNQPKIIHIP